MTQVTIIVGFHFRDEAIMMLLGSGIMLENKVEKINGNNTKFHAFSNS